MPQVREIRQRAIKLTLREVVVIYWIMIISFIFHFARDMVE